MTISRKTIIVQPLQDNFRRHLWNEAGQLSLFVSNEYCGYYAYDAQGNRAYKLTGTVVADQYDAGTMQATAYFDDVTLYVNPYMVVTPRGYTKHYYNGSQRMAARLGGPWRQDSTFVQGTQLIARAENLWESVTNTEDLGEQNILSADVYVGGNRQVLPACQYGPNITQLSGYHGDDMLSRVFSGRASERTLTDTIGIYFYHPDHLGSSNWITNSQGQAVQYIHYMPFGELWVNQQANSYDERFKFTGKERDTESGYDYFGARYYSPMLGHWLSVDKLADDYPHITPYAQSVWNPIKYKDPDGNWVHIAAGAAIGAIISGGYALYEGKSLSEVGAAALGGAVAGGISAATLGAATSIVAGIGLGAVGGFIGGGTGNLVEQGVNIATGTQQEVNIQDALSAAVTGGVVEAVGGGTSSAVSNVTNKMLQKIEHKYQSEAIEKAIRKEVTMEKRQTGQKTYQSRINKATKQRIESLKQADEIVVKSTSSAIRNGVNPAITSTIENEY